MLITIFLIVNIVSVVLNWDTPRMVPAIISGIVNLFMFGIYRNFRDDTRDLPAYAVWFSTISGIVGVVLLILGIVG